MDGGLNKLYNGEFIGGFYNGRIYSLRASGVTTYYYVDSTVATSGDGLSKSSPWKLLANIVWPTIQSSINAGDVVILYFKRGGVWTTTTGHAIAAAGVSGRPLRLDAYGVGAPPEILNTTAGYPSLGTGNKSYIDIYNLYMMGLQVTATSNEINLNQVIVSESLGVPVDWLGLNGTIRKSIIQGGRERGIRLNNAGASVTVRGSQIIGAKLSGAVALAGTLDIDYCLLSGNSGNLVDTYAGCTMGAHNIYEEDPGWTAWPANTSYFSVGIDDTGVLAEGSHAGHAVALRDVCDTYGARLSYYVNGPSAQGYSVVADDIVKMQDIIDSGHEVTNHTSVHSSMGLVSYPNLLRITSVNTAPQVNLDIAGNQILLTCTEGGAKNITMAIGSGQTIEDLITAIGGTTASPTGNGWTVARGYGNLQPTYTDWKTPIKSGVDSGGAQNAPWTIVLDLTRFCEYMYDDCATWMAANLTMIDGITPYASPITGYPYGLESTGVEDWLLANGYTGARGYNINAEYLYSVNLYNSASYTAAKFKLAGDNEAGIRKMARWAFIHARCQGTTMQLTSHTDSELSALKLGYILDEFEKLGGGLVYVTNGEYVAAIKADAGYTTSNNKTYSKTTLTYSPNYQLTSGSVCIGTGDPSLDYGADIEGNLYTTKNIGPYA